MNQVTPGKALAIENKFSCTSEDIYRGTTMKMKISREIVYSSDEIICKEQFRTALQAVDEFKESKKSARKSM
ncbi:DNAJ heat shock family protein, putative [Medicago truncatula]|uniref:DNAJ heat shock family protein, putative n=1 Tax=Medicago truncatula TaxID=3880 RepID=G7KR30_MEDTR|nr:DNAJ heat shock family protein, putative [Medicago truncatula]